MIMNKYIKNSLWLLVEKVVSILGALFITIYTARYLGPEKMGNINYAMALGAIAVPISQLGSQTLIFDKTAKSRKTGIFLLVATSKIRFSIFLIVSLLIVLSQYLMGNEDGLLILSFILLSCFFTSQDAYKPFFDATFQSKKNSIAAQVGLFSALVSRLGLVYSSASLVFFTLPYIMHTAIPFFIRKKWFAKETNEYSFPQRKIRRYRSFASSAGVPLTLSSLSIILYVKVGQLILGSQVGLHDVGLYNAASTLAQGWLFLPVTIITVGLAKVIGDGESKEIGFSFISFLILIISSIIASFFVFFNNEIIQLTYGTEFKGAADSLIILSISSVFSALGTVSYRMIIHYGGYTFLMKKMLIMAVFNIGLSFYLIGEYGLYGAALAVLITEFLSSTLFNYTFKSGLVLSIHARCIFSLNYLRLKN